MSYASYTISNLEAEVAELREKNTILKAERDEAINMRDEMEQLLLNLLSRIHRDGGQYTDEVGVIASLMKADQLIVIMQAVTDMHATGATTH